MMDQEARAGSPSVEWIEARFNQVERTNASLRTRSRLLSLAVLASWVGLAFVARRDEAPVGGERIVAQEFVLVDSDGVERARLGLNAERTAELALRDRDTTDRLRLSVRADGAPGMAIADAQGNRRIVMGLLPDETTTLVFADRGGAIRAVLGLSGDERANLVFADQKGNTRAALGVDAAGEATLMLPESGPEDHVGSGSPPVGDDR